MKARLYWSRQLPVLFGIVVLSFIATTVFTHWRLLAIDRAALDIAENAAPSIETLAAARGEVRVQQVNLVQYVTQDVAESRGARDPLGASRRSMDELIDRYLELPVFPGEQALWAEILRQRNAFDEATARCVSEANRGRLDDATAVLRDDVSPAADALTVAITRDIEFNAHHSQDLALQIRQLRDRSMSIAYALDALCALITIASALVLYRAVRAHADLAERHRRILEERASELEQFAGRVAHDILSPLNGARFALELAGESDDAEKRVRYVARGTKGFDRVQRLVHGLLEFARSGAKPDSSTQTDAGPLISELGAELQPDAEASGVELHVRADIGCAVACNAGVLTSMVSNLARNAFKYIGDAHVRRVDIRALDRGDVMRVEVEDTGPGLPPGLEAHVFEPYVRGPKATQAGIGLGLATVKRLALAHGGRAGVHSRPGEGCIFWFELPTVRAKPLGLATRASACTTQTG